jgi:hypothetical protein
VAGVPASGVIQRLGDQQVGSGLDRSRVASLGGGEDLDREGSRVGEGRQGRPKARLGQDRRVDPVGEFPKLVEGRLRLVGRLGE